MCLVSRQLGFVISPKFSYYLVPRSTTSPLILSSLVREHPDIRRFAFLFFFVSFFLPPPPPFFPTIAPIGLFAPHFPLKISSSPPLSTSLLLCNQRVSPTNSPTAPRLSSPFNSTRIETRQKCAMRAIFGRLGFNRRFSTIGVKEGLLPLPLIGIGAFERRAIESIWR